jgi:hypothetical protein
MDEIDDLRDDIEYYRDLLALVGEPMAIHSLKALIAAKEKKLRAMTFAASAEAGREAGEA